MNQGEPPPNIRDNVAAALREPDILKGAAAAVGLFLSTMFIPILGLFMGSFTPAPLAYQYYLRGRIPGLTAAGLAVVTVGLLFILSHRPFGGIVFMEYALLAVAIGEGLRRGLGPGALVGVSTGVVLGTAALILTWGSISVGQNPVTFANKMLEKQVLVSIELYQSILTGTLPAPGKRDGGSKEDRMAPGDTEIRQNNLDPTDIPDVKSIPGLPTTSEFAKVVRLLIKIFPGLMIIGTALVVWANLMMIRVLLFRRRITPPHLTGLMFWRAPEMMVWVVIACGFCMFLPFGLLKTVGMNCLLVAGLIYFFQGLAIVSYWLDKKGAPPVIRAVIYTLIALQQYLALIIAAMGLMDMWFDFRKIKEAGEGS